MQGIKKDALNIPQIKIIGIYYVLKSLMSFSLSYLLLSKCHGLVFHRLTLLALWKKQFHSPT